LTNNNIYFTPKKIYHCIEETSDSITYNKSKLPGHTHITSFTYRILCYVTILLTLNQTHVRTHSIV